MLLWSMRLKYYSISSGSLTNRNVSVEFLLLESRDSDFLTMLSIT